MRKAKTKPPLSRKMVFLAANSSYAHTNLVEWYLRSFTADLAWDWETVELVAGEEPYPALNRVLALKPDAVAASLYVFNRSCVLAILRRLKAAAPDCPTMVGGPELLGDNRALLERERCIDAAIRGEGETAFRELLLQIDTPAKWREIKGFCGFVDGAYVDNGFAAEIAQLDDIPSPYRASLAGAVERHKPFVQLETSRGCCNRCAFCTSGRAGSVRYFSLARVKSDLEAIRSAGMRSVRVVDRTFNDNTRRCVELLRMFRTEFQDVGFHLEIDPAKAGPSVLVQLAAARKGQFHIDAGLQSFSGDVMRNCDRRGSAEETGAGLAKLCALDGVAVHAGLIAGLPGQTLGQAFDDLHRLVALKPAEIQLELLKLLPGTRLADEHGQWGLVASPVAPYEVIRTAAMSEDDVFSAHWLSKLVDWFYGAEQLRGIIQQANGEMALADRLHGSAGAFRPGGPAAGMAPSRPLDGMGGRASRRAAGGDGCRTGSGFWPAFCEFCRAKPGLWMKPSLAHRFALLKEFFDANGDLRLVHALQYAWMKHGLGPGGICEARPWKEGIPPDAVLVEGDASAEVAHWHVVELDGTCLFGYGRGRCREAVAVYCLD